MWNTLKSGPEEYRRVRMGIEKERGNEEREEIKKNLKEATVCQQGKP